MKDAVQIRSSVNKEDLQHIFKAMRDGLYVIIRYNSSGVAKEHRCVPIRIYLDFSILYLNVYDEEKGHLITMAMTKIESVNLTRDKALSSLMDELREYLASAWGKMLRHDKKMISDAVFEADNFILPHFVNNPMHESQKIKREGGKNIVSLKTHHPVEFVRWSLRYGEDITVIGGEEVMTEMKRYIEMLNNKYCS
jgi:predicted DNA-binding transcriptional regulator YafY